VRAKFAFFAKLLKNLNASKEQAKFLGVVTSIKELYSDIYAI
jgi:hypothetical protein